MTAEKREQILEIIADILEEQPDMRFGQLIASLALFGKGPIKSATWDVEDDELLAAAKKHLENLREHKRARIEAKRLVTSAREAVTV